MKTSGILCLKLEHCLAGEATKARGMYEGMTDSTCGGAFDGYSARLDLTEDERLQIYRALEQSLRTEMELNELLVLLPESQGGLLCSDGTAKSI